MSIHSQVSIFTAAALAVCALATAPAAAAMSSDSTGAASQAAAGNPAARTSQDQGGSVRTTVFRCASAGGAAPLFSDTPCPGAGRSQPWQPNAMAQGIVRSGGPAGAPAIRRAATTASATRDDPFVDCQRRGGRLDIASRICRLPDDAARAMFRSE